MAPFTGDEYQTAGVKNFDDFRRVWSGWTASTTNQATTSIWDIWTRDTTSANDQEPRIQTFNASQPERTPEAIRRQRLHDARYRGVEKREEKQKAKAEDRAKRLLLNLIGKTDYKKFLQFGYLDVEGNSGKTYRIRPRSRIEVLEEDIVIESLCITTPNHYLPKFDEIIWKKLLAETNEELLLRVANHFSVG